MSQLERKPRILIVDDNPNIHRDFELVFAAESKNQDLEAEEKRLFGGSSAGSTVQSVYELDHALSGVDAVGKVRQACQAGQNYQMAFVDIRMPGIDGVETIVRLWKLDPAIQIVICTAFADYSQEDLTARLGLTDKLLVLKKPFDTIEVTQLAGTLTSKWYLARQAEMKLEQMELLVARRTEKVLELQRREAREIHELDQKNLQFLNNLAHEFRTPLALLVARLEQLLAGGQLKLKDQETLRSHADRLLHLVEHLADSPTLAGEEAKPATLEKVKASALGPEPKTGPASAAEGPDGLDEAATGKEELPLLLLIQAEQELRRHIRQSFAAEYRTAEANDGKEGFELAREAMPDLIIADSAAARINGVELCAKLKSDDLTSHIPVILLSNHGGEEQQLRALEAGADEFIIKPFRVPLIKARVGNLLESRRRLRERFDYSARLVPRDSVTNQMDLQFLQRVISIIERNLSDFEFDVDSLARQAAVSRRQLFRKMKAITGSTPNMQIRAMRLNRAAKLLKESQLTVTEITYAVGFSDLKHFREVFREQFGLLPGEYAEQTGSGSAR